jgi:hypothetical protein
MSKAKTKQTTVNEVAPPPLLIEANTLINGQRQQDYGDKLANFTQIAMGVNMVLATKLTVPVTADDVAMIMMQVKIARLAKSPAHRDSILDVAGYAGCMDKLQEERRTGATSAGILGNVMRNLKD